MDTAAQTLHRLTAYEPGREWTEPIADPRILTDFEPNDLGRLPWFYKRYDSSLPRVPLPRHLVSTSDPALSVLAGTASPRQRSLSVDALATLLHLSAGVVRTMQRPYGTYLFRAAGSAGGRFPMELYAVLPEALGDVPAGVHWYDPLEHSLVRVGPRPTSESPSIVVTGVPWRTGWRYRERGFRHVYWDSGTLLSQLLACADSLGLVPRLFTRFPDADVTDLVGADGVHEWPVAVVGLGEGAPAITAGGTATSGAIDAAPLEFPLVTAAQHAGDLDTWGAAWDFGAPVAAGAGTSVAGTRGAGRTVEDVVLARGSQRRMRADRGLPLELMTTSMSVAMRGISVPHFVVVHNVEDLAPGVYRWPDLTTSVRSGELRKEMFFVCLEQELGRDAAFVAVGACDVSALDDRQYREAQLAAGLVEGRLHLLAYAMGAGASGMTFLDSEMPALLGERLDGLLFTCVGVPAYRSRSGGRPGAPADVRMVPPR